MLQPNTFYRTSIKALIFDENKKILLTKEEGTNKWDFPGGGMDWGETPQTCLAREIQEEMGISTTWVSDYPSYFIPDQSERGVWFTFTMYEAKLEHLNFKPSDECIEVRFLSPEEAMKENVYSNVRKFLELYRPERHL